MLRPFYGSCKDAQNILGYWHGTAKLTANLVAEFKAACTDHFRGLTRTKKGLSASWGAWEKGHSGREASLLVTEYTQFSGRVPCRPTSTLKVACTPELAPCPSSGANSGAIQENPVCPDLPPCSYSGANWGAIHKNQCVTFLLFTPM